MAELQEGGVCASAGVTNRSFPKHIVSPLEMKPEGFLGTKGLLKGVGAFFPFLWHVPLTLAFCSSLRFVSLIFSTVCGVRTFIIVSH